MPLPTELPIPSAPSTGSRWRHFKGHEVTVLGVGQHSETGELCVAYMHEGRMWIRPWAMWADEARPGVQRFAPAT